MSGVSFFKSPGLELVKYAQVQTLNRIGLDPKRLVSVKYFLNSGEKPFRLSVMELHFSNTSGNA